MLLVFDEELEVLRDMQPLDRDVFNYLAERVDFVTGVIGRFRAVSHSGIALDLSERDQARRAKDKLRKLTTSNIENAIKRLVAAGLLERLSGPRLCDCLVLRRFFWVRALGGDESAQKADAAKMLLQMTAAHGIFKLNNNKLSAENEFRCQGESVSDATTLKELLLLQKVDENFVMFLEWSPSEDELSMIFHRAGVDKSKVKPEWLSEFVSYWWGEGKRSYNQREWTARYCKQAISFLRNPARADDLLGLGGVKQRHVGAEHYPDYARVPKDDAQLVPWMARHGYGVPLPGHSYQQARALLRVAIERRLKDERGRMS